MQIESRRSERAALHVDGDPVFFSAGLETTGEYHCADCGYGIWVRTVLPVCPMCHGSEWEEPANGPYGRSSL